ncbi:MAG: dTDP-4-dehydrorhamnose reductase [Eubacterium sp.]|nr:dTDP-4-dehydrorhamnose reductase [Eubacterium sp.]
MKIIVTGAQGQLGTDLTAELLKRDHQVTSLDVEQLDITDSGAVQAAFARIRPDVTIHCAAWTAVDAAEDNREQCFAVNAAGTENIARACKEQGSRMIYISTDYVFDGQGERPWEPDDPVTRPLNVYGASKYAGEQAVRELVKEHFIVRTAWVFGHGGGNFVKTMLGLADRYDRLTVVNDQYGTPTYTPDLARLLADMAESDRFGTYHATNEGGYISWYDFACEIFAQAGKKVEVVPVTSEEYGAKAIRPRNSRLNRDKLRREGFEPLPDWRDALARYLKPADREIS